MPWPNQLLIIILEICGRKLKKLKIQLKLPTCIDGVTGDINIAELFSNKYNELYNSVRYEHQSLNLIV